MTVPSRLRVKTLTHNNGRKFKKIEREKSKVTKKSEDLILSEEPYFNNFVLYNCIIYQINVSTQKFERGVRKSY